VNDSLNSGRRTAKGRPLLTIAIPSFKAPSNLAKTLEMLVPEVAANRELIHLVISDNNSQDESIRIAEESAVWASLGQLPDIHSQSENLGFRGNLEYLDSVSRGEFVWFLGVGDYPSPGVIERVLEELQRPLTQALNLRGKVGPTESTQETISVDEHWKDQADLPLYAESISLNVLKRGLISSIPRAETNTGDYWPHIEAILHVLEGSITDPSWNTRHVPSTEVVLSPNPDGWWFETAATPMDLYLARLSLVKGISSARPDSEWASKLLSSFMTWHLIEFAVMLRLRESPPSIPFETAMALFRKGVQPLWAMSFIVLCKFPKALLRVLAGRSLVKGAWERINQGSSRR
jgi:hypothetical protein